MGAAGENDPVWTRERFFLERMAERLRADSGQLGIDATVEGIDQGAVYTFLGGDLVMKMTTFGPNRRPQYTLSKKGWRTLLDLRNIEYYESKAEHD